MDIGNVKNPFLFDDPAPSTDPIEMGGNPFLNGSNFDYTSAAVSYTGINPFSDQVDETASNAMNIFGDQQSFVSEINPFGNMIGTALHSQQTNMGGLDLFGATSVPTEPSLPDNIFSTTPAQNKPPPPRPPSPLKDLHSDAPSFLINSGSSPVRPPPPRPPPPSKETKDLLQTVIGAMEATTDTLQDKLNTTRTPCPSPGSVGAHGSRSPTPDIQITSPEKQHDSFSAIFGQTIELSDQEVDENQTNTSAPAEQDPSKVASSSEEIDLFGDPVPTKPKTTQDILSLFNMPMKAEQVDLLSGDLLSETGNEASKDAESVPSEIQSELKNLPISEIKSEPTLGDEFNLPAVKSEQMSEELGSPEELSEMSDAEPETIIEKRRTSYQDQYDKLQQPEVTQNVKETESEDFKTDDITDTVSGLSTSHEKEQVVESPSSSGSLEFPPPPEPSEIFGIPSEPIQNESIDPSVTLEQPMSSVFDAPAELPEAYEKNAETSPVGCVNAFEGILQNDNLENNASNIFGEIPIADENYPDSREASNIFGESSESSEGAKVPTDSSELSEGAKVFGDTSVPITSETYEAPPDVSNIFGGYSSNTDSFPESSSTSNVFNDTVAPASSHNAFEIFGSGMDIVPPTSLGADTTGATLFGTTTPAPNVGMSLFGGGQEAALDIFAESDGNKMVNPFAPSPPNVSQGVTTLSISDTKVVTDEEFDAFSARFENVSATTEVQEASLDPFASNAYRAPSPWGDDGTAKEPDNFGFGDNAQFDDFLAMNEPPPVPQSTPRKMGRQTSADSDDAHMSVVIKPAMQTEFGSKTAGSASPVPVLAPPPAAMTAAFADTTPRFNPFDKSMQDASEAAPFGFPVASLKEGPLERSESQETPPTPLFEEDQSVPLEPILRTSYDGRTWEMYLRQPNKKKITGQRFWKKIFVKFTDAGALQLFNNLDDKEPFQELPLQPCYSVSDIGAQQFDQFGKIFTVKLQYIFYKERPGVRPGQISKAERITNKLSKFAQYAIAGDYEGVKEFASDVRKLGMPVEHAPQISQLLKLGTQNYEDLKLFASLIEENMFRLPSSRDRALTYKTEEVQLTAVDELYVEQDVNGVVTQMLARVRIFFLGFLSGMPEVDLGINDIKKQGREVVGRHDIIPVITEEWIRLEDIEFHNTVNKEEFEKSRHIKYKPPDGCYIELMRFRVRPPKNRELPLRVKTKMIIQGKRIELNCEILVPGFCGRKLGQVPCEDVAVRFPLPECWIYMFRVEKHFRYGSVKSAHRRTGKVKGIERLKGAVESAEAALMEVTSGQAKYEHQHRSIVWRISRLPKEGQGAYTMHHFMCKMNLTAFDQMPETFDKYCFVEFTMPATTVSHCVMRSVSITSDEPPEKYVRYLARYEFKTEMEFSSGSGPNEYIAATMKTEDSNKDVEKHPQPVIEESSSDESS